MIRSLATVLLAFALVAAVLPLRASVMPAAVKTGCCARLQQDEQSRNCNHHPMQSQPEQQCCAACAIGLAVLANSTSVVAPQFTGEEAFADYAVDEHARKERPPVPPPRSLDV